MPSVGQKFGRYRVEEEIGALKKKSEPGGMGVVYRAYDEKLGCEIAIKVLTPAALNHAATRKRLLTEAHILSRLNHPSIRRFTTSKPLKGTIY